MDVPDVGNTHVRIAKEIEACVYRLQEVVHDLTSIAEECEELGLVNTASDIDAATDGLKYAKDDCLFHRTVLPLG